MAQHVIRLSGSFTPGWAGRLFGALAARQVSVVSGQARRRSPTVWEIELKVEPLDPRLDVASLDCAAFARPPSGEGRPPPVRLTRHRVARGEADLEVEVRALDTAGFLQGLLDVFALFMLFPREMVIDTVGGEVRDRFRLQGMGGAEPSPEVAAALAARLEELTRG